MFKKTFLIILLLSLPLNFAFAQNLKNAFDKNGALGSVAGGAGYSSNTDQNTALNTVSEIINVFLSLLGVIFLSLMIYGGYLWMVDQGNNDKMKQAQKLITAAVTGLVIIVLAYSISYFVVLKVGQGTLQKAGGSSNETPDNTAEPKS